MFSFLLQYLLQVPSHDGFTEVFSLADANPLKISLPAASYSASTSQKSGPQATSIWYRYFSVPFWRWFPLSVTF